MENSHSITLDSNESLANDVQKNQETDTLSSIRQTYTKTDMAQFDIKNAVCNTNDEQEDIENIVDDYWNISNSEFKQQFLLIVNDDDLRKIQIQQWFETDDHGLFQFIRQRSSLIANVYSLKMEQDFWKNYNMNTQIEALWLSKMSKSMINMTYISEIFLRTQHDMNQHLKIIEKQLKQAIEKLTEHLLEEQEDFLKLPNTQQMKSFILAIIIRFIRQNQQQLCTKYNEKHGQLMLIVDDIRIVKAFYDLKPTLLQMNLAQTIWRIMILQEQTKSKIINFEQEMCTNNDIDSYTGLQKFLDDPMYAQLTVDQFKERFLTREISLMKAQLDTYAQDIQHQQELFLTSSKYEQNFTVNAQIILDVIENRRRTLKICLQSINEFSTTLSDIINENDHHHYDHQSDTSSEDTYPFFICNH